jgi:hypothetical protein
MSDITKCPGEQEVDATTYQSCEKKCTCDRYLASDSGVGQSWMQMPAEPPCPYYVQWGKE